MLLHVDTDAAETLDLSKVGSPLGVVVQAEGPLRSSRGFTNQEKINNLAKFLLDRF